MKNIKETTTQKLDILKLSDTSYEITERCGVNP